MKKFTLAINDGQVVVSNTDTDSIVAEISFQREITFSPNITLSPDETIAVWELVKYDNICFFTERPYEKGLKPIKPDVKTWEAIKLFIYNATYHHVTSYEYDEDNGDIYVFSSKKDCKRLGSILAANKIRHALQTDQERYCVVIYSNLINQIEQLNEYVKTHMNSRNYQTVKVTFKESLSKTDLMFSDMDSWGVASVKEWIDCYESSRFTSISDREAIITSDYNMDLIKEWLNKQDIAESIEDFN